MPAGLGKAADAMVELCVMRGLFSKYLRRNHNSIQNSTVSTNCSCQLRKNPPFKRGNWDIILSKDKKKYPKTIAASHGTYSYQL